MYVGGRGFYDGFLRFCKFFTGLNPCCGIVSDLVGFWSFLDGVVFSKDACDNNL